MTVKCSDRHRDDDKDERVQHAPAEGAGLERSREAGAAVAIWGTNGLGILHGGSVGQLGIQALGILAAVVGTAARGADVVGGAGVDAPTGRQIEPPGTSTVSIDASFTASRSAKSTSAASAIRIQ